MDYSNTDHGVDKFGSDWQYSNVRVIDPIDARGSTPDIIAVLTKFDSNAIKIRIDFLKLSQEENYELGIYIDAKPGGNKLITYHNFQWDYLITYDNSGSIHLHSQNLGEVNYTKLRASIDYRDNYLLITMGNIDRYMDSNTKIFIVATHSSASTLVSDQAGPFLVGGSPPPPIELSFVFWNVLDSSTPATILRSWAGAHTGPQSSRHGLYYLLNAAETWEIPINICNFSDPEIAFALDYVQASDFSNKLLENGTINTSDSCNIDAYENNPPELLLSNHLLENPSGFIALILNQHFASTNDQIIIGDDLSESILGTPEAVHSIFSYITSHPWIRVTGYPDSLVQLIDSRQDINIIEVQNRSILYTITGVPIYSGLSDLDIQTSVRIELASLPTNIIAEWAADIYTMLVKSYSPNITLSRGSYLSQLGHFIEAAKWAENPSDMNTCEIDIDWDGEPECILATPNTFLTFELVGGYLAFAFHINSSGAHQIIGPTTQFGVLRSDPSELLSTRGIAGDQGQIIGAYADPLSSLKKYSGTPVSSTHLYLVSVDLNVTKSFIIQNNVIHVRISDNQPGNVGKYQVPLVLDPWLMYTSPLVYRGTSLKDTWSWITDDHIGVEIATDTAYQHYAFNDTYDMLAYPEDPNFDYTLGHYLPIPMALVEFSYQPIINVDLTILP